MLNAVTFARLARRPTLIEEELRASKSKIIVLDEIQKLPSLLDEVHRLIELYQVRFLLTGSSTRNA